jgi:hypothetical protein
MEKLQGAAYSDDTKQREYVEDMHNNYSSGPGYGKLGDNPKTKFKKKK